ncbi:hypothetical protein F5B20DRAFT_594814 [Whalleya microplaca]|nr:hypothetical protein F5B20DRAFT_594814 [Whalleya microplaca]
MANIEAFTLLAIALTIIGIRVWARWVQVGPSNWQVDDYLMPLTGVAFTLETGAAYLVRALFDGLTNCYMTDEERAALDPNSREYYNRQWGSKIQLIGWSLYAFILWALKFCVAVFYGRLTAGLAHLTIRVRIAYVFLGITYIAVALSILLGCQPMPKYWQIYPNPGALCQPTNSKLNVYGVVVPNIVTDMYLLSIPLPLLWVVNISLRRKLILTVLFSGAIFIMVAGTIRAVLLLQAGPQGALVGSQWACRETFVAIVVANLPIIQPFLRTAASKVGLSNLFTKSTENSENHPLGSKSSGRGFKKVSRKKGTHPLSLPQDTAWESDEHILSQYYVTVRRIALNFALNISKVRDIE